jgi:hypothetical protein
MLCRSRAAGGSAACCAVRRSTRRSTWPRARRSGVTCPDAAVKRSAEQAGERRQIEDRVEGEIKGLVAWIRQVSGAFQNFLGLFSEFSSHGYHLVRKSLASFVI